MKATFAEQALYTATFYLIFMVALMAVLSITG